MKEKYLFIPPKPKFTNKVIDKKELKKLMSWAFSNYGTGRSSYLADKLKDLGFHYATRAGISLSVEDLKVPPTKRDLLNKTNEEIKFTEQKYQRGEITTVERFQKVIDTWNNASESLKDEVINYFKETDPLNPIYMMAFSGARGNISQVRQLVGMRGLMSDPQGQIIDLPIKSNFREGLTTTEYIISSYGARKGLVDTALRTADSGYLTRRLVDVSQDIIIREIDCGTTRGILLKTMIDKNKILIPLERRLLGRVLFETIYSPDTANVIAHINQDLDYETATKIVTSGVKSVIVRSPLTCDSSRSVCQFCYGWNLAHGSLVDLGEAIGIIAAQSIGEPGTQLTMRTFHTGGVFTGELAEQIKAPFDGLLRFPTDVRTRLIRTRHGEEAVVLEEGLQLTLYSYKAFKSKLELKQGTMLFLSDNEQFKKGQVIAEMSARGNMITERVTKDLSTEISGQVYFSDLITEDKIDRQGNTTVTTSKGGLLWILEGDVYTVPSFSQIAVKEDEVVEQDDVLAFTQVVSDYGGIVRLNGSEPINCEEIQIVTSSVSLDNGIVKAMKDTLSSDSPYCLELLSGTTFLMHCSPGNKLSHSQIIAERLDTSYLTPTGGIIKYENLETDESVESQVDSPLTAIHGGNIIWISEETHEINKDISLLYVEQGQYLVSGQEILKDLYNNIEGYVSVIQENGIVREVVIKPGYFVAFENEPDKILTDSQIVEIGEEIIPGKIATERMFVEPLVCKAQIGLLVRPIKNYLIHSNEDLLLEQTCVTDSSHGIELRVINRLPFKDGERIKSIEGVEVLKTYLILETDSSVPHLCADIEFVPVTNSELCKLQLVVLENLSIKQDTFGDINRDFTVTTLSVQDNQKISSGTIVAQTKLLCASSGQVKTVSTSNNASRKILVSTPANEKRIELNGLTPQVAKGDLVRAGDQLANNIIASNSGQIVYLDTNTIIIRSGCPYLISSGAILQITNLDLVQRGDILAILVFERSKTGDIVQGLPRIEEILEGRKPKEPCKLSHRPGIVRVSYSVEDYNNIKIVEPDANITDYLISPVQKIIVSNGESIGLASPITDGAPNPHEMLSIFFGFYKTIVHLYDAAKFSLQKVQLYLVNEVQSVYQSQNVDISDKHIEVIVRQMTSKVKVEDGGDTTLLPGELVELQQIDNINEAMTLTKGMPATYSPMLLGITKSSLNTDSFISAASFQETTRVLTEAAIEGKADWLRGLKENVIIGRLIPAGTGFNAYLDNSKPVAVEKQNEVSYSYYINNKYPEEAKGLDDFILDDNIARNYGKSDL
uniref:DNA-directed RNA polymerase n=1 Tax=Chroomonas placoidea TaxID=173977 RepID=A0A222AI75_9CRYP|nr:RNA polymerase beta'' subunit [Chroomonas placoidea]ASO76080.1 RNA polymerase beta'' subunit [Chroomonas placoidea]